MSLALYTTTESSANEYWNPFSSLLTKSFTYIRNKIIIIINNDKIIEMNSVLHLFSNHRFTSSLMISCPYSRPLPNILNGIKLSTSWFFYNFVNTVSYTPYNVKAPEEDKIRWIVNKQEIPIYDCK